MPKQCKGHHGFYIYCHCYRFLLLDKGHEAENLSVCFYQTEWFAEKLCNFIIRNYMQLSLLIRSVVFSLHTCTILTFSLLLLHWRIGVTLSMFFQVYRDVTIVPISSKLFVVTYYKVTLLYTYFFFLSGKIQEIT